MKIILEGKQKLFFFSDPHYAHTNICRGVSNWNLETTKTRNFNSINEMNDMIVSNINNAVSPDDILFCLGDFAFSGIENIEIFRNRINCKNLHLVLGNHDHHIERNKENVRRFFSSVNHYVHLSVNVPNGSITNKHTLILCHYPIASWDSMKKGTIHLHGHCHLEFNQKMGPGKMIDVGLDGNNLEPYELNEILSIMDKQPVKSMMSIDHHDS